MIASFVQLSLSRPISALPIRIWEFAYSVQNMNILGVPRGTGKVISFFQ
jgi:hypothetical protein